MSQTVARYDEMRHAIVACHAVDEVKDIRDKMLALEIYARQAGDMQLERQVHEIRVRAERRAGALLREMPKANGARGTGSNQHKVGSPKSTPPLLSDYGINKAQSSEWQKLAAVPEDDFEEALANPMALPRTGDIIASYEAKTAPPRPKSPPVDDRALWLWGKLKDFEREGLLAVHPDELIETMLGHMKETTRELAPRVAAWLQRISP